MTETFFAAVSSLELQQGDIIDEVPWGLIEAPTTICRPVDRKQPKGKANYGPATDVTKPAAWSHDPEFIHGVGWQGLAVVLWHGCQIDRWKNQGRADLSKAFTGVAPLLPLSRLDPAKHDDVRERRSHPFFTYRE